MQGEPVEELEISEQVFGLEPHTVAMHAAVVARLANERQGTHSTLGRAEVRGGGRKPWRQKGTGRARSGTSRSPLWRGGGVIFGPKPRDYRQNLPKKVKRLALCSALSDKLRSEKLIVLDELQFEEPRTKNMTALLKTLGVDKKALVILLGNENNVNLSARNIPRVKMARADGLDILDVIKSDVLVFTRGSVARTEEVFADA
jgi:large subunit ribosomal protein L4